METIEALRLCYLSTLQDRGYAGETIRNRRTVLRPFMAWLAARGVMAAAELSDSHVVAYAAALVRSRRDQGPSLARSTQIEYLTALRSFLRWGERAAGLTRGLADALPVPRRGRTLPRAVLSVAEVERVLAMPNATTPVGLRDRAMLEVFYSTGVRRLELIRLCRRDVDRERGTVLVREGKGRRDRVVPIGQRALRWIDRYLVEVRPRMARSPEKDTLFLTSRGNPFRPARLSERVRAYVEAARVNCTGSCHLFRHTFATVLLDGGADVRYVQEMMGHALLSTTAIYTHVSIGRLVAVHARAHPAEREELGGV